MAKVRPIDLAIALAGGTQEHLARRIQCSQSAVSKWVRGLPISAESARLIEAEFPDVDGVTLVSFLPEFAPKRAPRITDG